ncbi:hypothetical protein [Brenneria uluponensis]|uniref:hypothetical protein n=1 Tax=Brenneria uluponensis TaxID=3057057 RepID=UPI0028EACEA1|nr:hypothetical protein [Brenneria ulupoensis]
MKKDKTSGADVTDNFRKVYAANVKEVDRIQCGFASNHGYLIWTGEFKNGTAIGTVPCDGSICGGFCLRDPEE